MNTIISNTRVNSYSTCKRQHHYRYEEGIEPKLYNLSHAMYRGIIGHEALAAYYRELKEGSSVDTAKLAAADVIQKEIFKVIKSDQFDPKRIDLLGKLKMLIDNYVEVYRVDSFKVLEIEKDFFVQIAPEIYLGIRLDLLVQLTKGDFRGDVVVVDHKIVFNFKSMFELLLDGQLPEYISTVDEASEYKVTKGMFNQLRYREMKNPSRDDLFQRIYPPINHTERKNIRAERIDLAYEIVNRPSPPFRTLSSFICKSCYFQSVCKADLIGEDTTLLKKTHFQPKTNIFVDFAEHLG